VIWEREGACGDSHSGAQNRAVEVARDCHRNVERNLPDVVERGEQGPLGEERRGHLRCEGARSYEECRIIDGGGACRAVAVKRSHTEMGHRDVKWSGQTLALLGSCGQPAATAARPTPGKMYALLPCPGSRRRPPTVAPSIGEPEAKTARPPDHAYASVARHSALDVGLESEKMTGASWRAAMASTTSWVNALGTAATPISTLGLSILMHSSKVSHPVLSAGGVRNPHPFGIGGTAS
jgi:hypothetical protein